MGLIRVLAEDTVADTVEFEERDIPCAGPPQRCGETFALAERNGTICGAVDDQERRRVGTDVGNRRRLFLAIGECLSRAGQQR